MEGSGSNVGVERVATEQVIEGEATRNVLEKQLIRWAKRGDTTPSVLNVERLQFRNTGPVTVVAFDDGKPGQKIDVLGDGQTTVNHNAKIIRAGAAAALLATGAVYTFTMWEDRVWHESQASGGGGGGGGGVTTFNTRAGAVVPVATDYTPAFIGAIPTTEKGAANGVAQLDAATLVPKAQLGTGIADATKFLRGDGTWQVPSTAGGTVVWDWDAPNNPPSAIDDEFNAALSGWTNVGIATTQAVAGGKLDLSSAGTGAAANSGGIERALPAGNFSVITRVDVVALGAFSLCGIYVRSSVSGKIKFWSSQIAGSSNYRDRNVAVCDYSAFNNRTAFGGNILHTLPVFLRIDYDGTNLRFHFSFDGVGWILYQSITMVSYFSGGNLPDKVGLLVDAFSAVAPRGMFDFFRYYNAAGANTGALVTSSGGGGGGGTDNTLLGDFTADTVEAANVITSTLQVYAADGVTPVLTSGVEVMVKVTDAANDSEPSGSASLSAGGLGTMMGGSGSATGVFRTDANGKISVSVLEPGAVHRYLWIVASANTRRVVIAKAAVHEIIFT